MLDAGFSPMAGHVGRLDVQTSGVILVTADSALHRAILHQPDKSDGVELTKEYTLLLLGQHRSGSHAIASLAEPLTFSRSSSLVYADAARVRRLCCFQDDAIAAGGYRNIYRVAAYPNISSGPTDEGTEADARCGWLTEVSVQICQGRHHQIRRLCARAGLHLLHLRRVAIGPVRLGDMRPGEVRLLGSEERRGFTRHAGCASSPPCNAVRSRRAWPSSVSDGESSSRGGGGRRRRAAGRKRRQPPR